MKEIEMTNGTKFAFERFGNMLLRFGDYWFQIEMRNDTAYYRVALEPNTYQCKFGKSRPCIIKIKAD